MVPLFFGSGLAVVERVKWSGKSWRMKSTAMNVVEERALPTSNVGKKKN
jgi:hypothetical protein